MKNKKCHNNFGRHLRGKEITGLEITGFWWDEMAVVEKEIEELVKNDSSFKITVLGDGLKRCQIPIE